MRSSSSRSWASLLLAGIAVGPVLSAWLVPSRAASPATRSESSSSSVVPLVAQTARVPVPDTLWFGGKDATTGLPLEGGTWTFDDGTMQGWSSAESFNPRPYFRHVTADSASTHADPVDPTITAAGSVGSMWCGVHADEALDMCWPGGQGYGNYWSQALRKTFTFLFFPSSISISLDYFVDLECMFDFGYVFAYHEPTGYRSGPYNPSPGSQPCFDLQNRGYSGSVPEGLALGSPASPMSASMTILDWPFADEITIEIVAVTDPIYSDALDELGIYLDTSYGAFGVDNVDVEGGGIDDLSDFEPTEIPGEEYDGWTPAVIAPGPLAAVSHLSGLDPVPDPAGCELSEYVLHVSATGGSSPAHPRWQAESVISNAIAVSDVADVEGVVVEFDGFLEGHTESGVGYLVRTQYYPWTCPENGTVGWTPIGVGPLVLETAEGCSRHIVDSSAFLPPDGVDSVRVELLVIGECGWMGYGTPCGPEGSNDSPYIDNVRLGLLIPGSPEADLEIFVGLAGLPGFEGETITYVLRVRNLGPDAATGVRVSDPLPSSLTFLEAFPDQGTYDSTTGDWDVGDVDVGASFEMKLQATVNPGTAGTTIDNTAVIVASDQADPRSINDSMTSSFVVLHSAPVDALYGAAVSGDLVRIDPVTGEGSLVATYDATWTALAVSPLGGLIATQDYDVETCWLDAEVPQRTCVPNPSLFDAMDYSPDGTLYGLWFGIFVTYDFPTDVVHYVTQIVDPVLTGFAFDPLDGRVWACSDDYIYTVDLDAGTVDPVGPAFRLGLHDLEFDSLGKLVAIGGFPFESAYLVDVDKETGRTMNARTVWTDQIRDIARLDAPLLHAGGTNSTPAGAFLGHARPNPFRSRTRISFLLPVRARVAVDVFDVSGRFVRSLTHEEWPAGAHEIELSAADARRDRLPPGVYFVRLEAGSIEATRRVIVTP